MHVWKIIGSVAILGASLGLPAALAASPPQRMARSASIPDSTPPRANPAEAKAPLTTSFSEGFDDITTLVGNGWVLQNNSSPLGSTNWFQGTNVGIGGPFDALDGASNAYIGANYNNTGSTGTISNWLVTPVLDFGAGANLTFYTRKDTPDSYADRLEVRLNTVNSGADVGSTASSVGDFTTLELSINPNLVLNVYPTSWTQYTINSLPHNGQGRIAFRYFVTGAGFSGTNSDYIGIDRVVYSAGTPEFQVGGTVNGLAGSGLTLQLNGSDDLPIAADGTFKFPTYITDGGSYAVTVSAQPSNVNQTCAVSNGGGVISGADVGNVDVTCTTTNYTISGNVSGLAGTGLTLQFNGANDLPIAGDGPFAFPAIADGSAYAVTVSAQPGNLSQTCAVTNDAGTLAGADVGNVGVTCTTNNFTVSGSISGLSGPNLQLQINGSDTQAIAAGATSFAFSALVDGTPWIVTVAHQPDMQTCNITGSSGTLAGANFTDVAVNCTTNKYTVSGSISDLSGSNLQLQINGGDTQVIAAGATSFAFSALVDGTPWLVTVAHQPGTPKQVCSVTNGSGTLAGANFTAVAVNCTTNTYSIGGSINGLSGSNLQLQINGGGTQTIAASATSFVFAAVPDATVWTVSVSQQPDSPTQTCNVAGGTGTLAGADVNTLNVNCTTNTYTVGGSVSGLTGAGLTLQLNGGNDLPIFGGAGFIFATPIYSGSNYLVTISQQPSGQTCSVSNVSGTVTNANINSVSVSCAGQQAQLTLTIDDGHAYARYGQVLDYLVTLTNNGDAAANNVSVTSSGTSLDLTNAHWQCIGGSNGAACTTSSDGVFNDTVTLPPNRSVEWIVSVPVADTNAPIVGLEVNATGAASVADFDAPVLFRDGFDVANGDGARAPVLAGADISDGDASEVFTLPASSGNRIDTVKLLRSGSNEIHVECMALGDSAYVRLLQHAASGAEHASAWVVVAHGAHLVIGSVAGINGGRVVLLEGAQQPLAIPLDR